MVHFGHPHPSIKRLPVSAMEKMKPLNPEAESLFSIHIWYRIWILWWPVLIEQCRLPKRRNPSNGNQQSRSLFKCRVAHPAPTLPQRKNLKRKGKEEGKKKKSKKIQRYSFIYVCAYLRMYAYKQHFPMDHNELFLPYELEDISQFQVMLRWKTYDQDHKTCLFLNPIDIGFQDSNSKEKLEKSIRSWQAFCLPFSTWCLINFLYLRMVKEITYILKKIN